MTISYERQTSIIDIEDYRENGITIIGCGSIGSFLAMSLAKMGLTNFTLYDFDNVENHNLPNQFFGIKDIGRNKMFVTVDYMKQFNDKIKVKTIGRYIGDEINDVIAISCVDTMEVRKQIFKSCKKNKLVQLFIDTRMGGLEGQIYFVDMTDNKEIENYEKSLFSDDESVKLRCTERSILFTVLGIVSFVCAQIVKVLKGEEIRNYIVVDFKEIQMI